MVKATSYEPSIPELKTIPRPPITRYGADISKEVLDNIPAFKDKQGELSQFLNTIESYSMIYRVHKTGLVLLHSRGKAHKIISHAIMEDPGMEWLDIKRKLMSNYGSTKSRIKASVKISKLSMSSDKTVGEYLTRILRRVSQFKTYKEFFNHIKDEWEEEEEQERVTHKVQLQRLMKFTHGMRQYQNTTLKQKCWQKSTKYTTDTRGQGGQRSYTPRHQNTTVANQAYTFNSTTPNTSINYIPGTFNMGAPFSTHHQVPYGYQANQQQAQPSQQRVNSFTQDQSNTVQHKQTQQHY